MPKRSAAVLLYRGDQSSGDQASGEARLEVLAVHPGGPFWAKKDLGSWSLPKGEYTDDEDPMTAAVREFTEELGSPPPAGELVDLGEVRQRGGKLIRAWALQGDLCVDEIASNTFEMEWPPKSGEIRSFPEVDRAEWFTIEEARKKLNPGQVPLLDELVVRLS
ncbi:MAG TPA: NUDIX domain-containing protein [Microthrixaceae bacterium]|nr:NUDIX domain-containing protein [Microthrixaceae bacterium]